jgi:hypothetical protein
VPWSVANRQLRAACRGMEPNWPADRGLVPHGASPCGGSVAAGAAVRNPRPTGGAGILRWPEPFRPCHDQSAACGRLRRRHLMGGGRTISAGRRAPGRTGIPRPCRFNFEHWMNSMAGLFCQDEPGRSIHAVRLRLPTPTTT